MICILQQLFHKHHRVIVVPEHINSKKWNNVNCTTHGIGQFKTKGITMRMKKFLFNQNAIKIMESSILTRLIIYRYNNYYLRSGFAQLIVVSDKPKRKYGVPQGNPLGLPLLVVHFIRLLALLATQILSLCIHIHIYGALL